jgi:hypothetical protein
MYVASGDSEEVADTKRPRLSDRQASDAEEVEAGLALAGLGRGQSDSDIKPKGKGKTAAEKKVKKEKEEMKVKETGDQLEEKPIRVEAKKSCSECRRLKAKCDRVFPCSNCELNASIASGRGTVKGSN